jgi:hypothetical protein
MLLPQPDHSSVMHRCLGLQQRPLGGSVTQQVLPLFEAALLMRSRSAVVPAGGGGRGYQRMGYKREAGGDGAAPMRRPLRFMARQGFKSPKKSFSASSLR